LTQVSNCATMLHMRCAHIVAATIALGACTTTAHAQATATLTVIVQDVSGVRISGARITATNEASGKRFDTTADATGEAVVQLAPGSYDLKVQAMGFISWAARNADVSAETKRTVTLNIGGVCSPCLVIVEPPDIPLEYQTPAAEIPLITMQQLAAPAKPLPRRSHWF